jgi:hypothetical protein
MHPCLYCAAVRMYTSIHNVTSKNLLLSTWSLLQLGTMGVDQGYETIRLKCSVKGLSIAPETVSAEVLKSLIGDAERYK